MGVVECFNNHSTNITTYLLQDMRQLFHEHGAAVNFYFSNMDGYITVYSIQHFRMFSFIYIYYACGVILYLVSVTTHQL